jgi:hypothetical protein
MRRSESGGWLTFPYVSIRAIIVGSDQPLGVGGQSGGVDHDAREEVSAVFSFFSFFSFFFFIVCFFFLHVGAGLGGAVSSAAVSSAACSCVGAQPKAGSAARWVRAGAAGRRDRRRRRGDADAPAPYRPAGEPQRLVIESLCSERTGD